MFTIVLILIAAGLLLYVLYRSAPAKPGAESAPPALSQDVRPFGTALLLTTERPAAWRSGLASLGVRLFAFDRLTGEVLETISTYNLELSESENIGFRIDAAQLFPIIERAEFIVTHGVTVWKEAFLRVLPVLATKAWACSRNDIDWAREGVADPSSLRELAAAAGLSVNGHTGPAADTELVLGLLKRRGADGRPAMAQVLENLQSRGSAVRAAR